MNRLSIACLIVLLCACSKHNVETTSTKGSDDINHEPIVATAESTDKTHSSIAAHKETRLDAGMKVESLVKNGGLTQQTIKLNNEVFLTDKVSLIKGDSIYNSNMSNFGKLTGAFVLVSDTEPSQYAKHFIITKLANETYQLMIKDKAADLLTWYKRFKKEQNLQKIEISIDYTPQGKQATY